MVSKHLLEKVSHTVHDTQEILHGIRTNVEKIGKLASISKADISKINTRLNQMENHTCSSHQTACETRTSSFWRWSFRGFSLTTKHPPEHARTTYSLGSGLSDAIWYLAVAIIFVASVAIGGVNTDQAYTRADRSDANRNRSDTSNDESDSLAWMNNREYM